MASGARKEALSALKYETASELGVTLKDGYNGDLTSAQAGSIGGSMVRKLIQKAAGTTGSTTGSGSGYGMK